MPFQVFCFCKNWCLSQAFPGNLAAMPPEVLRGLLIPGASDVYGQALGSAARSEIVRIESVASGLGILLWWLLTGQDCGV